MSHTDEMLGALGLFLAVSSPVCDYRVTASSGAEVLNIEARIPAGAAKTLSLDPAVAPYVELPSDAGASTETIPCGVSGCVVRYRFRLADAARELASRKWAFAEGEGLYATPSAWLFRPTQSSATTRFHLEVLTTGKTRFVSGLRRASEPSSYEGPMTALEDAPWSGFAPFELSSDVVGVANIETAIAPGPLLVTQAEVRTWAVRAATQVATFYGSFPVSRVAVMVLPSSGDGVGFGTAMGNGGAAVLIWLGAQATPVSLARDWVLPHELTHFAVPSLPRENMWLEEGIATYVEPLGRARSGQLSIDAYWATLLTKVPLGLPAPGDRGLDRTATWARTYWGGALFCFLADVELRTKTSNRQSLDTALKGILAAGGTQEVSWDLKRTLKAADAATGLTVMSTLHGKLGAAPGEVNLPALFKKLGVSLKQGEVSYDDAAPLASVRKAMTAAY